MGGAGTLAQMGSRRNRYEPGSSHASSSLRPLSRLLVRRGGSDKEKGVERDGCEDALEGRKILVPKRQWKVGSLLKGGPSHDPKRDAALPKRNRRPRKSKGVADTQIRGIPTTHSHKEHTHLRGGDSRA